MFCGHDREGFLALCTICRTQNHAEYRGTSLVLCALAQAEQPCTEARVASYMAAVAHCFVRDEDALAESNRPQPWF